MPKSRKEKAPARGERSERKIKASCLCRAEKAESEEDHTAWPGAARCDGKVCALRWQSQRAAMAKHARCDGKVCAQAFLGQYAAKRKGTRWFVGHKKPPIGNEHTAPRKEVKINGSKKALKTILRYLTMRGQPYMRAKRRCLMCRIHLASWTGALHTSTVQPKAGRSENIYFIGKVSLLHSPSSLGLDGHEQLLSRLEDAQEVPKEPSSPCWQIGFPCTAS